PTMATAAPASASPRTMPSPMPPLPPVTIATLPPRLNCPAFIVLSGCCQVLIVNRQNARSAPALPDQDQPDGAEHRAIACPLQLIDHEARRRPGDYAGALADPQEAYGECKEANDQERSAHGFSSL